MRFVVDESTGAAVTVLLRGLGHDTLFIGESAPQTRDDDILALAVAENRIVVTNDKDFGELVYRHGLIHVGIVLLRLQDESAANKVAVMQNLLANYSDRLVGHFVVATETHVRVR